MANGAPQGYDPSSFPMSYRDPAYAEADQVASNALGLPPGLLTSVRTKGERSNADQISSASAATPYQITPGTRASVLEQTGVDGYASPEAAAYAAGYVLKQNLGRYGGDPVRAVAAYNGGTDPTKWNAGVMAYAKRTTGFTPNSYTHGETPNPFGGGQNPYAVQRLPNIGNAPGAVDNGQQSGAAPGGAYQVQPLPNIGQSPGSVDSSSGPSPLQQIYSAYKSGQMTPEDKAAFEQDVQAGRIVLPAGSDVATPQPQPSGPQQQVAPAQLVSTFNRGQMALDDAAQFQKDVQSGALTLPPGAQLSAPQQLPSTVGGQLARQGGLLARDVIQGAGNAVGVAYDPIAATMNAAGRLVGNDPNIATLGSQAAALADRLGLPTPATGTERVVNAATQGAAEAAGFAGAGGAASELPGIVGQLGKTFGADAGKQMTAMAAGQAAAQHAQDAGLSPMAQTAINVGTTLLTLGGASAAEGLASKASPAVNALAQRLYAAGRGDAQASAAGSIEPTMQASDGAQASQTPAAQGTQPETTGAAAPQPAALPDASAEQAQIGGMMARMQEGQVRAAAAGDAAMPQGGYVGAQEAAAGADMNPAAAGTSGGTRAAESVPQAESVNAGAAPTGTAGGAAAADSAPAAGAPGVELHPPGTPNGAAAALEGAASESGAAAAGGEGAAQVAAPHEQAIVPDDQEARREIIGLMQRASGQDRTITPQAVQAARQQLLARFQIEPATVDSARDLGMLDNLQPDHLATDLQMIKLNQLLKSDPSNPMAAQEAQGLTRAGQRAIDLFSEMGAAPDISALSQKVNDFLSSQYAAVKRTASDIYDRQIPALVSRTEQVAPTATLSNINDELAGLGGDQSALSREERQLLSQLSPKDETVTLPSGQRMLGSALGVPPRNPTYGLIDRVRKELVAAENGQDSPFRNMAQWRRQQLIQSLAKDQGSFLEANHPEAYGLWQTANANTVMYKAMEKDMKSLFGNATERSMLPTLRNAIQGLAKGNVEGFNKIVGAIPKSMRSEVLTTALQNMFTKTGVSELGPFGWQEFSRFWRAFKSDDKSYGALMANLEPDARSTVSKLIKVSDRISNSISQKIYTGRSRFAKDLRDEINDVPSTVFERLRSAVGPAIGHGMGNAAAMAAHHVPVVGSVVAPVARGIGNVAADIITPNKMPVEKALSDFYLSDDAKGMVENGPAATPQQFKAAANSPTGKRLYDVVRHVTSPNDPASRERWLRAALASSAAISNSSAARTNRGHYV
jgi:hypothetical protein